MELFLSHTQFINSLSEDFFFEKVTSICDEKNAILKKEKIHFRYSYIQNLGLLGLCVKRIELESEAEKNKNSVFDKIVEKISELVDLGEDFAFFTSGLVFRLGEGSQDSLEANFFLGELIKILAKKEFSLKTYKTANLALSLYNRLGLLSFKLESSVITKLTTVSKSIIVPKTMSNFLTSQISSNEKVNSQIEQPFLLEAALYYTAKPLKSGKAAAKFFFSMRKTLETAKENKQKKSFQLLVFLRYFLTNLSQTFIAQLDFEDALKRSSNSGHEIDLTDLIIHTMEYWMTQFKSKNKEARLGASYFEKELARVVREGASANFAYLLLKIMRNRTTHNIKGKNFTIMQDCYSNLCLDLEIWDQYFDFIVERINESEKVSEINYYLNELESLAQHSLGAKNFKSQKKLAKEISKRKIKIAKFLTKYYFESRDETSFSENIRDGNYLN